MKEKDFDVIKSESEFLENYALHDIAQNAGKKFLLRLNYNLKPFGEDRRYENLWEDGEDKPDHIILNKSNKEICLIDWKGKKSNGYRINKRAYNSYLAISKKLQLPLIIASAKINDKNEIIAFKYFILTKSLVFKEKKEWDGNITVIFNPEKANDLKEIDKFLNTL